MTVERSALTKWGPLAGITMVFIASIGMVEVFDKRMLVAPILSLGYLALYWVPVVFGYLATKQVEVEGVETRPAGRDDVITGAVTGLVGGVIFALFLVLFDAVHLRDIFPKLGPALFDLLTFGRGLGFGIVAALALPTLLGAAGAAIHLMSDGQRRITSAVLQWVFAVALLSGVITQILQELGIRRVARYLFEDGGLKLIPAAVVALIAGYLSIRLQGKVRQWRTSFKEADQEERRKRSLQWAIVVAVLFIGLPFIVGGQVNELLANVGLFMLMGLGLNIVIGFAGLLDLGYVAFFAVGAYTTAILTSPLSPRFSPELEFWVALPVVIVAAAIAGILVGTPVIRMRGDYLAIVTLGFGEIVRILFLSDWLSPTFGGAQGIRQIPGIDIGPIAIRGTSPQAIFYLVAIFVVLAAYVSYRLQDSRIGRAWAAMREDETVAEAMGINTVAAKLLAFVTGAILASFGGALFAAKVGSVFPNSFELLVSIIILVVVIVGGMGSIPGVAVGALVLIGILGGPTQPGLLQEFQEFKLLIYGALLIYMMLQRPEGLVPSVRRSRELHQDEMHQDAWYTGDPGTAAVQEEAT